MNRYVSPLWTAIALFSLAAAAAPSAAHSQIDNSAAQQGGEAQDAALAAALAAFEAAGTAFDAALASRDVPGSEKALRELAEARRRVEAIKSDPTFMQRYRERYNALEAFKTKLQLTRATIETALADAEADAAEGVWASIGPAVRRLDAALADAAAMLPEAELAAPRARIAKLREGFAAWQSSQALREREVAEVAAVRGEIARAGGLLARVASEQDFDAAERRVNEAAAAVDGAEARLKGLSNTEGPELRPSIVELRADIKRSRDAIAGNRASAVVRARVAKIVREVNALSAGPESQADMERLAADCDQARKELEGSDRVPAATAAELVDLLRTSRDRIARMRGTLDLEAAKRRAAEALAAADEAQGEANESIRSGAFDDADESIKSATEPLRRLEEALASVSDAPWREDMSRRGNAVRARLERASKAVLSARAGAALAEAIDQAEAAIASMSTEAWPGARARIAELGQGPEVPAAMRAKADAELAKLDSFVAYSKLVEKRTKPIDEAIAAGDFGAARVQLASLRSELTTTPLSGDHREFLNRLSDGFDDRIRSGEFVRMATIAVALVGGALLLAVAWMSMRRRSSGMAAEMRAARQRRDQKIRQFKSDCDRSTASDAVRTEAIERLAGFDRVDAAGFSPMVAGAAVAPPDWQDVVVLSGQLSALGEPEAARSLLDAAAREGLVPGIPLLKSVFSRLGVKGEAFIPFIEGSPTRLANGARAIEAAHAWTEVWAASSPAVRDLTAKSADHWFQVAVDWLPGHEDVPALFARAEFKRKQGNADEALKFLVGEGETAESRIKQRPAAVAPALKCRVFLLAANIKLDKAGVVSLSGKGSARAASWPVVDQYAANLQVFASASATGMPGASTLVAEARELLRRADQSLSTTSGSVSSSPGLASAPAAGLGSGAEASLRFQIDAAQFRVELGGGHQQAENALQRVLREAEPSGPGVLVSLSSDSPRDARLADGWSQLQPLLDSGALSTEDSRMVRDMRLNWVTWSIERGDAFGGGDRDARMRFYRKAAWLTCRYWLLAGKSAGAEQWVMKGALAKMASTVLAVEDRLDHSGAASKSRVLGSGGWNPVRDNGTADDKAVFAVLVEIIGTGSVVPPPPPPPPPPPGDKPPPITIVPPTSISNVWLVPGTPQPAERLEGKDVPVFGSLRIVDPTMSATGIDGAYAWIDVGGGEPAKAMGVFGYELLEVYKEPLRIVQRQVKDLDAAGSSIIGFVNQLADLTFDGLEKLSRGFKVVLSRPKPSMLPHLGAESGGVQSGERLCVPVEVPPDRVFAPAPHRRPPARINEEVIERFLFEICQFIAAVGVDAKPMPQFVNSFGAAAGGSPEAWMAIVRYFREQLGRNIGGVKDEIAARVQKAAVSGLVSAPPAFAETILDEQFIRATVVQLSCRPEEVRYVDAVAAWQRMDPALRAAMERLIRRFDERHPGIVGKDSLNKHFRIDLGAQQSPSQPPAAGPASIPVGPPASQAVPAGPDPRYARFLVLKSRVDQHLVGNWPYASNPAALDNRLQRWIVSLEPVRDSAATSRESSTEIAALITDIRAFQRELR